MIRMVLHAGTMGLKRAMKSQASEALVAIPYGTLLSTGFEWMVENGWTRCYPRIGDVGWTNYVFHTLMFLAMLEFGIYWAHRLMHDIKPIYKHIHTHHHRFSKDFILSPFAGDPCSGHETNCTIRFLIMRIS